MRPFNMMRRSYDTVFDHYNNFWHGNGNRYPITSPIPTFSLRRADRIPHDYEYYEDQDYDLGLDHTREQRELDSAPSVLEKRK